MEPLRNSQKPPFMPGQESRNPTDVELYLEGRIEKEAKPPFLSQHQQGRWNYSPPTTIIPEPALIDPSPGPVYGPFGPGTKTPAPGAGTGGGDAEEQDAPPVVRTGPAGYTPRRSPATTADFILSGRINSPLSDFLLPAGEFLRRAAESGR